MTRYIYILTNNGIPMYVGKTKDFKSRIQAHKRKYPNYKFEIIDEVPTSEWRFWERHYISLFRSWGFQLDNKKLYAGNGCDTMSDEAKKKLIGNKNALGYKHSKEHIDSLIGNKRGTGKRTKDFSIKLMGNKNGLGHILTKEHKEKIYKANKGNKYSLGIEPSNKTDLSKFNWNDIQTKHDSGILWSHLHKYIGVSKPVLLRAKNEGYINQNKFKHNVNS